jgi:hypothetical protein
MIAVGVGPATVAKLAKTFSRPVFHFGGRGLFCPGSNEGIPAALISRTTRYNGRLARRARLDVAARPCGYESKEAAN